MIRRHSHQAGESWRKFGQPLYAQPGPVPLPEVGPWWTIALWVACVVDGALAAFTVVGR